MLAAGNRQNHTGAPSHSLCERIVCRSIACVECHHHIHRIHALILCNVPMIKCQLVKSKLPAQAVAQCNHIFLQIQPYHPNRISIQLLQIIVHRKGQIGLSASEIQNREFSVLWELWKNVLDKLQEAINLAELVVARLHNLSFLCHHTQVHKKRHWLSLFQHIALFAVVRKERIGCCRGCRNADCRPFHFHCHLSLFTDQNQNTSLRRG